MRVSSPGEVEMYISRAGSGIAWILCEAGERSQTKMWNRKYGHFIADNPATAATN